MYVTLEEIERRMSEKDIASSDKVIEMMNRLACFEMRTIQRFSKQNKEVSPEDVYKLYMEARRVITQERDLYAMIGTYGRH